jgi:hypothetical protein
MNDKIEELLNDWRQISEAYSTSKAHFGYLEDFKKSKLAMLMKEAQLNGIQTTSGQEREAYAHKEYVDLLVAIQIANEQEAKDRFTLRGIELEIEVWRTLQANERMERKAYGG